MSEMIAGLFGVVGVFVGALMQYWFGRRAAEQARYLELKSQACADYLNSIASVAFASSEERPQALQKVAAAKARLCVFGDGPVIEEMVRLENTSLNLADPDAQKAFISLLQVMRKRGIAVGEVEDSAFQVLLFGQKPSNFVVPAELRSAGMGREV